MADRLVVLARTGAIIGAVAVATAFWAQAETSGLERSSAADIVFGALFVTSIVASPFILAFFLAPTLQDQRWTQWVLVAVIVGAAAWTVWLARQPIPPQGRDGIVFLVVPVVQCLAVAAVRAASDLSRNRTNTSDTTLL